MANNLRMYRGDTLNIDFQVKDDDGSVVDLSGATAWFTVKDQLTDSDASAIFQYQATEPTATTGITWTNASQGKYRVSINPADTDNLGDTVQELHWDSQVKTSAGEIYTVEKGKLLVEPEVTRSIS